MSDVALYYLQVASTFSVVFPLLLGLLKFKHLDFRSKFFILFLLVGFVIDLLGWYFYTSRNEVANLNTRNAYELFESIFLFWLIGNTSDNRIVRSIFLWGIFVLIPFWAFRFLDLNAISFYKTTIQLLLAIGSCVVLLKLVETREQAAKSIIFWLLLGVFFYCFSTFFIMGIQVSKLARIWYAHSLMNIFTNLIYFIGFLKLKSSF
jgi:hypothetical protein